MTRWIAIDLHPGHARGWMMTGDTAEARAEVTAPRTPPTDSTLAPLLDALRAALPDAATAPALICGLAPGPRCTPVAIPAKPEELLPLPLPGLNASAVPPLTQRSPFGIMVGMTARIAGFFALNPNWDGVLCLPGPETHWVQVSAREVVSFQSALSGTLTRTLSHAIPGLPDASAGGWDKDSFLDALDTTLSRPERLASGLAVLAAEAALGQLDSGAAPARLTGLTIGAELAAARPYWLGQQVALLGEPADIRPYVLALERQGVPCLQADPVRLGLAGLTALRRRMAR
ncbi:2-dehydro-3-deoxygalactonokinase [Pseudodonghicola flavimaris]|uniref:2-dehydro-3-deoxygalactonokinase n=1 Tax=Pseudodonghicola flavimaris TaxID=3050036 RepID=A0ABT7F3L3_9RHOB|nr:2-dehydro-3-deoxygalactonokinase [Pseudodonghicola flavimaris]MDK3019182.1 2-dehydro-3-deoxygalactonokinase [Pseudodonghicola flavimaris]